MSGRDKRGKGRGQQGGKSGLVHTRDAFRQIFDEGSLFNGGPYGAG